MSKYKTYWLKTTLNARRRREVLTFVRILRRIIPKRVDRYNQQVYICCICFFSKYATKAFWFSKIRVLSLKLVVSNVELPQCCRQSAAFRSALYMHIDLFHELKQCRRRPFAFHGHSCRPTSVVYFRQHDP